MNPDVVTIRNALRMFTGACHRLADNPSVKNDPVIKMDLERIRESDLAEAVSAMQRLTTTVVGAH